MAAMTTETTDPLACDMFAGIRRIGGTLQAVGAQQITFGNFAVSLVDDTLIVHYWPTYNGLTVSRSVGKEHAQLKIRRKT